MQPISMEHLLASVAPPGQCFYYAHPHGEDHSKGFRIGEFFGGDRSKLTYLYAENASKVNHKALHLVDLSLIAQEGRHDGRDVVHCRGSERAVMFPGSQSLLSLSLSEGHRSRVFMATYAVAWSESVVQSTVSEQHGTLHVSTAVKRNLTTSPHDFSIRRHLLDLTERRDGSDLARYTVGRLPPHLSAPNHCQITDECPPNEKVGAPPTQALRMLMFV